jgi:hydrogenase nickel incorporation protein HypA/HybF
MHELSIALSIIDGALEELSRQHAAHVSAVYLRLGRLSGVDKDALLFSYSAACQDTPLAGSQLIIEDVDVKVLCLSCACESRIKSFPVLTCADCGAVAERVTSGYQLEMTAMEIVE